MLTKRMGALLGIVVFATVVSSAWLFDGSRNADEATEASTPSVPAEVSALFGAAN